MYASFYHLTGKPFRLTPDPQIFFNSHSHKRAMSYLLYGLRQGEGFIVITGDVGTGKSTLVGALCAGLAEKSIIIARIVSTQLEAEEMLQVVAAEFGLSYRNVSKGVLLKEIESFLRETARRGKRALLLIDEAQNLPLRSVEELRMLSNFQIGGRALLQTFLLGQREFRNIMRSPSFEQLRQRVIAAYHLQPLSVEETKGYIEYRLRLAGWKQDPVLAEDIFQDIHQFTHGIPRRINILCDRLMLYGALEELHTIDLVAVQAVTSELQQEDLNMEVDVSIMSEIPGMPTAGNGLALGEQRLAAVEDSLAMIGTSIQKELALLRRTLAEVRQKSDEG